MKEKYKKLADTFLASSFWMAGTGHFDLYREDVEKILELLLEGGNLKEYYEELAEKRLG